MRVPLSCGKKCQQVDFQLIISSKQRIRESEINLNGKLCNLAQKSILHNKKYEQVWGQIA